jgi:hypothetical protein
VLQIVFERGVTRLFAAAILSMAPITMVMAQEAAPAAATAGPAVAAPALVSNGFRSAQYGMDEDAVRAAIKADFGIEGEAVVAGSNTVERTKVLTIRVPDVLPDGGLADVSYVFGYQSGELIQVGISWSSAIDPTVDAQRLYANGDVLVAYFASAGYVPETVRSGIVLNDGILLFRGEDSQGHATVLLLQGDFQTLGEDQQALNPVSLALLYAKDSDNPDIFQIQPGQF